MAFDQATVTRQIDLEVAALGSFIEILRAEQAALVRGETDLVASFVEAKARHAFELSRLDGERSRWLAGLGLGSGRAGMERALQEHARGAAQPRDAWQKLLKLAETARQLNTTNGMLIAARLQSTQRALSALFSTARLPGAYGADGGTVSLRTTQQLAVA